MYIIDWDEQLKDSYIRLRFRQPDYTFLFGTRIWVNHETTTRFLWLTWHKSQ